MVSQSCAERGTSVRNHPKSSWCQIPSEPRGGKPLPALTSSLISKSCAYPRAADAQVAPINTQRHTTLRQKNTTTWPEMMSRAVLIQAISCDRCIVANLPSSEYHNRPGSSGFERFVVQYSAGSRRSTAFLVRATCSPPLSQLSSHSIMYSCM